MKNDLLKCYVNGKKSACHICGDSVYLLSFNAAFDSGVRLNNMRGYQKAMKLPSASVDSFSPLGLESAIFADLGAVGVSVSSVCFEGSEKYAEYRANIRTYTKGAKKAAAPAAAAPAPAVAAAPVAAPVVTPAAPAEPDEIRHEKFNYIVSMVRAGIPVYLYGPAGSGKNVICEQVARALGLEFYFVNTVTQEYKLTGFIDAGGKYQETEFYKAYKNGGLFMLDELDASDPAALITINAALANKYFPFPCGTVKMHPNFRCMAAGNTIGRGASEMFSGRCVIDSATLDRFAAVPVEYDERIERTLTNDSNLIAFVHDLRRAAASVGVSLVLGYRPIMRVSALVSLAAGLPGVSLSDIINSAIIKGLDSDSVRGLYGALTDKENRFAVALRPLAGL